MKDLVYKNTHEMVMVSEDVAQMKCPKTGEWFPAVVYKTATGEVRVIEKKDFERTFKLFG